MGPVTISCSHQGVQGASEDVQSVVDNGDARCLHGKSPPRLSVSQDQGAIADNLMPTDMDFLGQPNDFWHDGIQDEDLDLLSLDPLDIDFSHTLNHSEHGFQDQNSQTPVQSNRGNCVNEAANAQSGDAQNASNTERVGDMATSPCDPVPICQSTNVEHVTNCSAPRSSVSPTHVPHHLPLSTAWHTGHLASTQGPPCCPSPMGMLPFPFGALNPLDPQQMALHMPPNGGCLDRMALALTGLTGPLDHQSLMSRFLGGCPSVPPIPGVPWASGFRPMMPFRCQNGGQMYGMNAQSIQKPQQNAADPRMGSFHGPPVWPLNLPLGQHLSQNIQQLPQESNQPRPPIPVQQGCETSREWSTDQGLERNASPIEPSSSLKGPQTAVNVPDAYQSQGFRPDGAQMQEAQV